MIIKDQIRPAQTERQLKGINIAQGCTKASHVLALHNTFETSDERSFETSESVANSIDTSISVGTSITSPEFFGTSSGITFNMETSVSVGN